MNPVPVSATATPETLEEQRDVSASPPPAGRHPGGKTADHYRRAVERVPVDADAAAADKALPAKRARVGSEPKNIIDKIEAFISRLSARDNFWAAICSLIWLPLAFFSGIRMKQVDAKTFAAVLPFRRFNRNFYRAMAGGALLANSEIAGGMYVFGIAGGDYTVVCKHLDYRFLRPCLGPAVYRMTPRENIQDLLATGKEFNITLDLEVTQQASRVGERDKRVGQCVATFHVTPKKQYKDRKARKAK